MANTPENGSLILLEQVQEMLDKGAPTEDMLSMSLRLQMYEIRRSNAQRETIDRLVRHDIVEWAITKPRQSITAAMIFTAVFISDSREWMVEQIKHVLGLK